MIKSIKDFKVKNKRILVRCDFNVPVDKNGKILDDFRLRKSLPTIKYLLKNKAKIILMSHLDDSDIGSKASIKPIGDRLEKLMGLKIKIAKDCVGSETKNKALNLKSGEILMLENLRINKEEVENDNDFAKKLSELGEIYINDAFAVCHRDHASISGVPKFLPSGAGLLLQKEIKNLSKIINNPKRPLVALMGGAKIGTKAKFIEKISEIADTLLIGGLIKKELVKENSIIIKNPKIFGPEDNLNALDIDEKTIGIFKEKIMLTKTILWNGPFGKFEEKKYAKGTLEIAKAIIKSKAFSVVGGGETVEFLDQNNLTSKFSHVSTGGGAMLDFLSGEKLPGIVALEK